MKGIVFTCFLEMVEDKFGIDMVDQIIDDSAIPSGGAFTAVGTYSHTEMVALLVELEKQVSIPIPQLLEAFGSFLFGKLATGYPAMLEGCSSSRDLLLKLDGVIHVEVAKLYPDAELPRFHTTEMENGDLHMHYLSDRHLEDLAKGLLNGCFAHFGETVELTAVPQEDESVIFKLHFL